MEVSTHAWAVALLLRMAERRATTPIEVPAVVVVSVVAAVVGMLAVDAPRS